MPVTLNENICDSMLEVLYNTLCERPVLKFWNFSPLSYAANRQKLAKTKSFFREGGVKIKCKLRGFEASYLFIQKYSSNTSYVPGIVLISGASTVSEGPWPPRDSEKQTLKVISKGVYTAVLLGSRCSLLWQL